MEFKEPNVHPPSTAYGTFTSLDSSTENSEMIKIAKFTNLQHHQSEINCLQAFADIWCQEVNTSGFGQQLEGDSVLNTHP